MRIIKVCTCPLARFDHIYIFFRTYTKKALQKSIIDFFLLRPMKAFHKVESLTFNSLNFFTIFLFLLFFQKNQRGILDSCYPFWGNFTMDPKRLNLTREQWLVIHGHCCKHNVAIMENEFLFRNSRLKQLLSSDESQSRDETAFFHHLLMAWSNIIIYTYI